MYRWVNSLSTTLKIAFFEMAEPERLPTRFECEWAQYFNQQRQHDFAHYTLAIQFPTQSILEKKYRLHTLYDIDNLSVRLKEYAANDFRVPLIFRTDRTFEEQWPYHKTGWIRSLNDIDHPIHHYRSRDQYLTTPHAKTEEGQRYVPDPRIIRGLIIGGRS